MIRRWLPQSVLFTLSLTVPASAQFMRGADISVQTLQEQGDEFTDGVVYNEYGVPKDAVTILQNHDMNWVRLRLFHTPDPGAYGASMGLDYVTELGARVKGQGFKFLLDIHYSDTWADPGQQTPPAAWLGLSHADLVTAVYQYTSNVIAYLRTNGAMPEMVQIGNETTCGMLWPDGEVCNNGNWQNYVELIDAAKAGIDAGRAAEPMPEIMIHIDRGGSQLDTQWFFDNLLSHGATFDVIGQSFYPEWHGTLDDLSANLTFMGNTYAQDVVVAETADYNTDVPGATPETQKEFLESLLRRVEATPNGKGRGVFYWEPTWMWNAPYGYRSLFAPINGAFDNVAMLMGLEAFNATEKYSTYSTSVSGVVSGSIMDGHHSDNAYETITEATTGGQPSKRISYAEHKWEVNNVSGNAMFAVEAYRTANSEGDDFVFAYSTNDVDYTDMLAVTQTSDSDTVQTFALPPGTTGTVFVRVTDTDRTQGASFKDSLYIDDMYIAIVSGPPDTTPPTPDPMTWDTLPYATGADSIAMIASVATDPSGVEYYFECTNSACNDSGWQSSNFYEDTGLSPETMYSYVVWARDASANHNQAAPSNAAAATTLAGCAAGTMHVESLSCTSTNGSRGSKYGQVMVTVLDDCGEFVAQADVTGSFAGGFDETVTEATNTSGSALLTTLSQVKNPHYDFCVEDLSHATLAHDPNDDVVTCCSY